MARITHFNPPADIAVLLGDSLNVNRGSRYAAASAYPSNHQLRTSPRCPGPAPTTWARSPTG
ncbi:MAG: hypothetical protein EOM92_15290 [Gammaproteobacteria bacterium]|nr:hypothetical protein [Gammaproteobacteria bacterium]